MGMGYYYDNNTRRYEYGESPFAQPTIEAAMRDGDSVPTAYKSVGDAGELSDGVANDGVAEAANPKASGTMAGAQGVQKSLASGGNAMDVAGSGLMAGGAATANPYLVGAGLGLTAMSSITKGKNARSQQEYEAEVIKYNQRQAAIQRMAEIGKGLKA